MFDTNKNKFEKFESKVWLSSPTMHGPELEYIKEAYDTNWMSTVGKNIFGLYTFNPMSYISPSNVLMDNGLIGFILEPLIIILVSGVIFFWKGAANEVL